MRFAALVAHFALLLLTLTTVVHAAEPPVIAAGREAEIVGLVRPYFGANKDFAPGFRLGDVDVQPRAIRFFVVGGTGKGAVRLEHPESAPKEAERTASFAISFEGANDANTPALRALVAIIRENDKGGFWPQTGPRPGYEDSPSSRFAKGKSRFLSNFRLPALLRDGVLLFFGGLTLTLLHLRRTLRNEPRSTWLWLLGLLVLGATLRLTLARETAMNVWPYNREVPLARLAFDGVVLPAVSAAFNLRFYLTDVIFKATTLLAIVTPLAFFAHARYVLRDTKGALFAVALLVVLPNHIRFSRADSEFIQSLATSSLTFVVLYTALRDPSRVWRSVCFALLPILSVATYFVRPENLFFYLVDIGAILLTSGDEAPRRRKWIAFVEVTAAAAFAFVVHLLAQYRSAVQEGLSLRTLWNAAALFFDVRLNTLINASITPPGLTMLAVAGGVLLYRRGERTRSVFLTLWLLGFFVVHSFVRPSQPEMQARYHLHLITPMLLLAASALPDLARLRPGFLAVGAVYFAASPLLHWRFIRNVEFNEMREFNFLRAASRTIPNECVVLELSPALGTDPDPVMASRLDRMSLMLDGGFAHRAFTVVNLGRLAGGTLNGEPHETLSAEARAVLEHPPPCLRFYEGLTCRSHRPPSTTSAPVCEEPRGRLALGVEATTTFGSHVYDEVQAGRLKNLPGGQTLCVVRLVEGESIPLTLYSPAR